MVHGVGSGPMGAEIGPDTGSGVDIGSGGQSNGLCGAEREVCQATSVQ